MSPPPARLHALDYARGLAAAGIMLYHYLTWWVQPFDATSPLGRIGIYGVAVFYVLSGLTMFHVYNDKTRTVGDVGRFFARRLFRILPLLWIVTILSLSLGNLLRAQGDLAPYLVPRPATPGDLALNLTGLFGFIDWSTYFSAGVWSIGNELVFYAIFPLLVAAAYVSRWALAALGAALLGAYLLFAYVLIDDRIPITAQWATYINPANQAFLFFGGFAIGFLLRRVHVRMRVAIASIAVGVAVLLLWPSGTDQVSIVTDGNRVAFTIACLVICAGAYKLTATFPRMVDRPLALLGEASYSVYLIHPIVAAALMLTAAAHWPAAVKIPLAVAATLVVSWACYRFFESPMMRLGRRITPYPSIVVVRA
ncbi:acyltransferase family protein [Microbacterium sp. HJ5]